MVITIIIIIVSITKFSIVIGSPLAYLSCNRCVSMWVSNYRYLIWTFCYWIPIIGQLMWNSSTWFSWVIFMSIVHALMASFTMLGFSLELVRTCAILVLYLEIMETFIDQRSEECCQVWSIHHTWEHTWQIGNRSQLKQCAALLQFWWRDWY